MKKETLSFDTINELIAYKDGTLFWKARKLEYFTSKGKRSKEHSMKKWNTKYAGKEALCSMGRYKTGSVLGITVYNHHVVWILNKGYWPTKVIDHENGNKYDNNIENLREVSQQENTRNQRKNKTSRNEKFGVYWIADRNKWCARIKANKKLLNLGYFETREEAIEARSNAEIKFNYHVNHGVLRLE